MDRIAAFDTLYTNNHIQMGKLLLPLLPKDKQYYFAIFIKYMELQHTIKYGKKLLYHIENGEKETINYQNLCQEFLPYCDQQEEKLVKQILSFLKTMETFNSLKPIMEMMNQFSMTGSGEGGDSSGFDFSSLFSMGDFLQGNLDLDLLNNLKDLIPDVGKSMFDRENNSKEATTKKEDRSIENE